MSTISATALALLMISAALLIIFGAKQLKNPADRQRGWLMIACGVIFVINVLIWTL